jgi:sterol 3beta-glucosyltransferase
MAGRIPVKFVVVTYGTEGDTRPLAALTRALIDAGHAAHLLADAATLGSAATLGVPATGLPGDFKGMIRANAELVETIATVQ